MDQLCTSRTGPIAPLESHSQSVGVVGKVGHAEELGGHAGLPGRVAGDAQLVENIGNRLVRDDVFALPHRPDGDHSVQVVGRHDVDGVEALFLVEQLAEVGIGAAGPGLALLGIMPVDQFEAHFAPAKSAAGAGRPVRIAEELADLVVELVGAPLRVVVALAIGIAHGHDLDRRMLQGGHELAQALRAAADEADLDLLAGRDVLRPAQGALWDDGRRADGRRRTEKLAAANLAFDTHDSTSLITWFVMWCRVGQASRGAVGERGLHAVGGVQHAGSGPILRLVVTSPGGASPPRPSAGCPRQSRRRRPSRRCTTPSCSLSRRGRRPPRRTCCRTSSPHAP